MHSQRNIYQSRMLDLLRNCLSDGQDGGCKQRGQTATIWLKALLMPRLAVCSRDLHWHWINWTLLYDTIEVSMLRLAWLPIAQHVFQPALTGRLELISRKIVSSEQEQRLSRWADFAKNCLPRIECKELPRFREKYRALGRHVCKIREIGGQKNGFQHATAIYPIPRYTRPRYIMLTPCTLYYNTRSTQKSPVRQHNAWFDTKKPGSTQKCPVRHKNVLPSMHQLTLPLSNTPLPLLWNFFFFQFYF